MAEAINRSWTHWFEIPVSNFERAKTFYETIYNMKIDSFEAGALKMGIFPHSGAGGEVLFKPKNQFLKNTVSWPSS
jgi:predicted enzyme related to lactoylglutathione lyase